MKTIGLIGGMCWQSTRVYYDLLNEAVAAARGGLHSAEILMRSVDFAGLEAAMRQGDWSGIEARLGDEAAALVAGGADCLLLCTNTMHKMFDGIAARVDVPFFHIADPLGQALAADGLRYLHQWLAHERVRAIAAALSSACGCGIAAAAGRSASLSFGFP